MTSMLLLAAVLCAGMVAAYPNGAPVSECGGMDPHHDVPPLPLPSPYVMTLSQNRVQPRANVIVKIIAPTGHTFRGFLVQARDSEDIPVGTFEVAEGVQSIDCLPGTQNAATHVARDDKTNVSFNWVAPSTPTNVTFTVTIVRVKTEFWVKQTLPLLVVAP